MPLFAVLRAFFGKEEDAVRRNHEFTHEQQAQSSWTRNTLRAPVRSIVAPLLLKGMLVAAGIQFCMALCGSFWLFWKFCGVFHRQYCLLA